MISPPPPETVNLCPQNGHLIWKLVLALQMPQIQSLLSGVQFNQQSARGRNVNSTEKTSGAEITFKLTLWNNSDSKKEYYFVLPLIFLKDSILLLGSKFTQMPKSSLDSHPRSNKPISKVFGAKCFIPAYLE